VPISLPLRSKPNASSQITTMTLPYLHPELLPRVLDYADRSTLATGLRLSSDVLPLAGKRLYRDLIYDPNTQPSLLLDLASPSRSNLSFYAIRRS